MTVAFEPFKPVSASLYLCDSKFHTEPLRQLLTSDDTTTGFIVIDGSSCLFGTVSGATKHVLETLSVMLPNKNRRGGQSALRFARLRLEKRHNWVRKIAEHARQHFIAADKVTVQALILAGCADFKHELDESDLFDPRLKAVVACIIDVGYGGLNGFQQAVALTAPVLAGVKLAHERRIIQRLFDEIAKNTGKYCYGAAATVTALEMGAVETLIVWEDAPTLCDVATSTTTNGTAAIEGREHIGTVLLSEWLVDNHGKYGAALKLVTDNSQEGAQFCRGFGGIAGLLRYPIPCSEFVGADGDDISEEDFM